MLERHSSRKPHNGPHQKVLLTLQTRAITVDHLQELFKGEDIAVACIFCNYQERSTQSLEELVASVLKQIIQNRPSVLKSIKEFYEEFCGQQWHPRLNNLIDALRLEIQTYSKVFIILDALDECQEDYQWGLITKLESISSKVYLMVTSHLLDLIKQKFPGACRMDINAEDGDVRKYIESRIRHGQTNNEILLGKMAQENPGLEDGIVEKIVANAGGMFVLLTSVSDSCTYCIPIPQVLDGQAAYGLTHGTEDCFRRPQGT